MRPKTGFPGPGLPAPSSVHSGPAKSGTRIRPSAAMSSVIATETVKQALLPSRSPLPMVLPQTTCTPAEIIAPGAAKASSTGWAKP